MALETCRGKNRGKVTSEGNSWSNESDSQVSGPTTDAGDMNDVSGSGKNGDSESEAVVLSSQDHVKGLEQHSVKKVGSLFLFCLCPLTPSLTRRLLVWILQHPLVCINITYDFQIYYLTISLFSFT